MTLKTRLAAMMLLVLVAVVAVQFVLAERERRQLAARLAQLSGELDRSTAVFVQRVSAMAAGGPLEAFEDLVADIDSSGHHSAVRVIVLADSAHRLPFVPPGFPRAMKFETLDRVETRRDSISLPVGGRGEIVWLREERVTAGDSVVRRRLQRFDRAVAPRGNDIVVNLPLPSPGSDSLFTVQMRYSYASLADELSRSRRRSLVWLAALLGVGAVAAIAVAGQFTRPIRALEASFVRVESGDLDVRVKPQRQDEIGHLTESFNDMVARLRESQRMAEQLAQHEHLASLGRLAAGIAHEIRNPLNAILLNLQQSPGASRGAAPAAPQSGQTDKYYARIVSEIERLDRLVTSFLDLAKSGELRLEPIDLTSSLRAAADLFRPVAEERGITLHVAASEPLRASGDPTRLPAVWNNLLANALEATPRGGRVTIAAHVVDDGSGDDGGGGHGDDGGGGGGRMRGGVEVTIADTGPGIAPEMRARVWEPFHSGREGGTGLGLAIVRSTVEHHGGTVEIDCPASGGTIVRVRLPPPHATLEQA